MIYYGQFNHVDYDREYLDSDVAAMLSLLTGGPGVINHPTGGLLVANVTGLQISVAAGGAWLGVPAGWYYYSDAEQLLTLDSETSGYNRIDRVVLRVDRNTEVRTVALDVVKGTATTSTPAAPALTQNETLYEMSLAQIAITGGSTSIAITDERDLIATASSALIAEDVINSLDGTTTDKPLSAAQGKALNDAKLPKTWVYDGLDSASTDYALSAAQGKALNDAKLNKSDVYNGLGSTSTALALSAAQGKALNDGKAPKASPIFTGQAVADSFFATYHYISTTQGLFRVSGAIVVQGSPSYQVQLRSGLNVICANAENTGYIPIYASAHSIGSSRRFKNVIGSMSAAQIEKLLDVEIVNFKYKQDFNADNDAEHMGVIAEDLFDLFPDAVTLDQDGQPEGVDYSKLAVPCIGMIQQQDARIEALENENTALTALLVSKGLLTQDEIDSL